MSFTYRINGKLVTTSKQLTVGELAAMRRGARIAKAKSKPEPMVPVFNEAGKLIGLADPAKLIPLGKVETEDDKPVPMPDTDPAPAGSIGTPASSVAKSDVLEGIRKRAVDEVNDAIARGESPEAVEAIRLLATQRAAGAINRHRSGRAWQ